MTTGQPNEFDARVSAPYSPRYYDQIKEDSAASALEVVPILIEMFHPRSVVDVGCGTGTWAAEYAKQGCEILGVDGGEVETGQLVIPATAFQKHDLAQSLRLGRRFDLVNCLEVAEHLPESHATGFVEDLCRLADVIVFSAAVPGQGGTHHVNEQWPSYWIPQFAAKGFQAWDCIRPQIWQKTGVAWWYVQNMFAFIHESRRGDFPAALEAASPWPADLVHPRAYVRATVPSEMSPRMIREVIRALPHFPRKIFTHFNRRSR